MDTGLEPNELERQIISKMTDVAKCSSPSNKDWTRLVKVAVAEAVLTPDCTIYANGQGIPSGTGSEWVFDLCACLQTNEGYLKEIVLALECEWSLNFHDRQWDFQKLLLAPARLRIFVIEDFTEGDITSCLRDCIREVQFSNIPRPGDRYLFFGYEKNGALFHHHVFEKAL